MSNVKILPWACLLAMAVITGCSSKGQEPEPAVNVLISIVGNGSVTSENNAITCAPTCSAEFQARSEVRLTAAATAGHQFIEWGGACDSAGSAPVCVLTVGDNGDTVSATFAEIQDLGDTWALLDGTTLISFDRDAPEDVQSVVELTNLAGGEVIVGMDFRVADNRLYGVGSLNNLYLLPHTATTPSADVTLVSAIQPQIITTGVTFGVDTDPVNDVLVVADGDTLHTVDFSTGATTSGAALAGRSLTAIAHTHSFANTEGSVLFGLDLSGDAATDGLVLIDDRVAGNSRDAGTLRVDGAASAGFDVVGSNLDAFALLNVESATRFFRINLANGVSTLIGSLELQRTVTALALPPTAPSAAIGDTLAITAEVQAAGNSLVNFSQFLSFNRDSPTTILGRQALVGLGVGEKVADADYRPADQVLYVLSDIGKLYFVNEFTGLLTLHATLADDGVGGDGGVYAGLGSSNLGAAFNPVDGQLWVVTASRQNLRVNPDSGEVSVQSELIYSDGSDANATAIDFTDSFDGARSVTPRVIDSDRDNFANLNGNDLGAEGGGPLGGDAGSINGFDIDPLSGVAYAALTVDGSTQLFVITQTDTDFGALVSPQAIGDGLTSIVSVVIKPPQSAIVYGVNAANELVSFLASDPATNLATVAISGTGAAQIMALDFRGSDSVLFGVGTDNRVYTINRDTGEATLSAEMFDSPNDPSDDFTGISASADGLGAAFNPLAGSGAASLRLTSAASENLRVIPATGETFTDSLSYAGIGVPPNLDLCDNTDDVVDASAVAYSQDRVTTNAANATIFVVASGTGGDTCLFTMDPASGELTAVGATQAASSAAVGLDIAGGQDGLAVGAFDTGAADSTVVTVNLGNGGESDAIVATGSGVLRSIAVALDPAN